MAWGPDGEEFVLDDGVGGEGPSLRAGNSPARPAATARPRGVAVAVVAAVALVAVGGVAVIRGLDLVPLPPPPDPAPDAGLLDAGGLDAVRLGQPSADFLAIGCDDDCLDGTAGTLFRDDVNDCTRWPMAPPADRVDGWAWVRDGEVVGVGVVSADGDVWQAPEGARLPDVLRTWPGLSLGDALDPVPDALDRWDVDAAAPVPVLRREHQGVVTTVADTTGDGRLDYATVATLDGDACRLDDTYWGHVGAADVQIAEGAEPIVDGTFAGVRLGMAAAEAQEVDGWSALDPGQGGPGACRLLIQDDIAWGGAAYVDDGTVIGIEGWTVQDGPRVGMTLAEAVTFLDPDSRDDSLPWEDFSPAEPQNLTYGTVRGTDSSGRPLGLAVSRDPGLVDGLDVPVTAPAALEPAVVVSVLVGEACTEPGGWSWW